MTSCSASSVGRAGQKYNFEKLLYSHTCTCMLFWLLIKMLRLKMIVPEIIIQRQEFIVFFYIGYVIANRLADC